MTIYWNYNIQSLIDTMLLIVNILIVYTYDCEKKF
jgi:hypothetical protein